MTLNTITNVLLMMVASSASTGTPIEVELVPAHTTKALHTTSKRYVSFALDNAYIRNHSRVRDFAPPPSLPTPFTRATLAISFLKRSHTHSHTTHPYLPAVAERPNQQHSYRLPRPYVEEDDEHGGSWWWIHPNRGEL
jgi:hypothetical protein